MPTIQIDTEQLLNAALQMPQSELEQFVTKLFTLKAKERAPVLSEREAELLDKIYQGLPAAMQQRLNELIEKRQSYTITPEELQELIELTNQVELFDAERLQHLIELAHLRNVPLHALIQQLGLKPVPHD
ncbi:MAG: STAS/SEC14 domain-containing protein [Blastocatellales bacterium]